MESGSGAGRKNIIHEKRRMRNERKKRKRAAAKKSSNATAIEDVKVAQEQGSKDVILYKNMSRGYRDRWHWELLKRREAMGKLKSQGKGTGASTSHNNTMSSMHEIGSDLLNDPIIDGKPTAQYIGRGSFSVVRLQTYRGIQVAVKEFLPKTIKEDVYEEAMLLSQLSHPFLPCFFGIVTTKRPFRVITQFQGIDNKPVTLSQEIRCQKIGITSAKTWVSLCAQLFEALNYLHRNLLILHNDIKCDNIILTEEKSVIEREYSIVLIDFGKATTKANGRRLVLSEIEKKEYLVRYRHIPPELVHGQARQNERSDMYSAGLVVQVIQERGLLAALQKKEMDGLMNLISMMCNSHFTLRPTADHCMHVLFKIIMKL